MKLTIEGKSKWYKPQAYFCPAGKKAEAIEIDYGPASDAVSAFCIQAVETSGVIGGREEVAEAFGKGAKNDLFLIKHADIETHEVTRGGLLSILADVETVAWMQTTDFSEVAEKFPDTSLNEYIAEANNRKKALVTEHDLPKAVKPEVKRSSSKTRTW